MELLEAAGVPEHGPQQIGNIVGGGLTLAVYAEPDGTVSENHNDRWASLGDMKEALAPGYVFVPSEGDLDVQRRRFVEQVAALTPYGEDWEPEEPFDAEQTVNSLIEQARRITEAGQ